ncbi:M4 family metallopeptidase [Clostridium algidicarnis]|uniref:M4 family metallopeptidase n=1 Tax=Clostridium algidicarnis TaxID=37659 RepID=UPI00209AEDF5|nr:M4 family metallopeptidase [Clostridium algidicarnis]
MSDIFGVLTKTYDKYSVANGGVHINSGIPNKTGYLVAQSIGCEKTARIYYRALTVYFNPTTNFAQARLGLVQAAQDLYGANSAEAKAVTDAFTAVGIN